MSEIKLKPCPFCGGGASLNRSMTLDGLNGWVVECDDYECIAYSSDSVYYGQDAAITRWNTRKPMERIVGQIKEMGNIKFSSFGKPLIAVEDIIAILEGGGQ